MKDSQKYYKNVKRLFPVHGKREKDFLNNFHEQVQEFEDDRKFCTYEQLEERFGTPLDIIKSYYDSIDSTYLLKRLNIRRIVTAVCVFICALALSLSLWKGYLYYIGYQQAMSQNVTEVEISAPEVIYDEKID